MLGCDLSRYNENGRNYRCERIFFISNLDNVVYVLFSDECVAVLHDCRDCLDLAFKFGGSHDELKKPFYGCREYYFVGFVIL